MMINCRRQGLTSVKRKTLNGWKRRDESTCGRIHMRPKHFLETLNKAKTGAAAEVNGFEFW